MLYDTETGKVIPPVKTWDDEFPGTGLLHEAAEMTYWSERAIEYMIEMVAAR